MEPNRREKCKIEIEEMVRDPRQVGAKAECEMTGPSIYKENKIRPGNL